MEGDKRMKKEMESLPMRMIKHHIEKMKHDIFWLEREKEEFEKSLKSKYCVLQIYEKQKKEIELEEAEFQKNKKVWIIHGFKNNEE